MRRTKTMCIECEGEFHVNDHGPENPLFCGERCRKANWRKRKSNCRLEKTCEYSGCKVVLVYGTAGRPKKYCDRHVIVKKAEAMARYNRQVDAAKALLKSQKPCVCRHSGCNTSISWNGDTRGPCLCHKHGGKRRIVTDDQGLVTEFWHRP